MKVTLSGTRGSIGCAGPDTVRYGGNTSSVLVETSEGRVIVLDAGTGIRAIGLRIEGVESVDILLTHLHMDHIQGLPFFEPLLDPDVRVAIWGPVSDTDDLRGQLSRYLSPPLFPVTIDELPSVEFHDLRPDTFDLGSVTITADAVSHPGATLGYRLVEDGRVLTYIPDHEPGLSASDSVDSGLALAQGADFLIHDAQYTDDEYAGHVGWGHTSHSQLLEFAASAEVERLVTFHHDPSHDDGELDAIHDDLRSRARGFEVLPGKIGLELDV